MKEALDLRGINFEDGYIAVVDKPLRWTSTDVVRKIKFALRRLGYRKIKVGHAGTLDPLATGILLVCIGRATKLVDALQAEEKEYVADVMLGATTPSHDLEHEIDRTYPWEHITREAVAEALASLTGERLQTPPVYSAKKIDGTRAYELARAGEEVAVRQALINIYEMEIVEYDLPRVRIRVRCSKGTYIRSLAHEIGQALRSGAHLTSLRRTLRFLFDGSYEEFKHALFALGETPLPKWVREKVEPEDAERYQTIFAEKEGAVAAPTAGMHFSKHLMKRMEIKGIDKTFVTLHVGLGNFRTVDVEDLSKHKMDSEQFFVEEAAAEAVNAAKRQERKVVAIGTTVMRTIETAVSTNGMIKPMEGWTNKFIFAPYEFTVADAMVTNLHLPYSTQLMMVAAFGGYETVMNAYKVAKEEGYRFGTYGDAMLIL